VVVFTEKCPKSHFKTASERGIMVHRFKAAAREGGIDSCHDDLGFRLSYGELQ